MKKITNIALIMLVAISLTSCLGGGDKKKSSDQEFRTESALNLYEVQIPKFMKATTGLNADASMQFQNIFEETYFAVIEESKQDFIDTFKELGDYNEANSPAKNYEEIQISYFTESMEISRMSDSKNIKINGNDAQQVEFAGKVPGIDFEIFYLMTFIEGKETLYMMMEWTLSESEDEYKDMFKEIAGTFKEI